MSAQQTRSVVLEASLQRVDGGDSWQLTDGRGGGGRRGESVHEPCIASRLSPILFRERSTDLSTILSTVTARDCAAMRGRACAQGSGSRGRVTDALQALRCGSGTLHLAVPAPSFPSSFTPPPREESFTLQLYYHMVKPCTHLEVTHRRNLHRRRYYYAATAPGCAWARNGLRGLGRGPCGRERAGGGANGR